MIGAARNATVGNPTAVYDATTKTVWLLLCSNNAADAEWQIHAREGKESRRVWVTSSADLGKSWARPKEITRSSCRAGRGTRRGRASVSSARAGGSWSRATTRRTSRSTTRPTYGSDAARAWSPTASTPTTTARRGRSAASRRATSRRSRSCPTATSCSTRATGRAPSAGASRSRPTGQDVGPRAARRDAHRARAAGVPGLDARGAEAPGGRQGRPRRAGDRGGRRRALLLQPVVRPARDAHRPPLRRRRRHVVIRALPRGGPSACSSMGLTHDGCLGVLYERGGQISLRACRRTRRARSAASEVSRIAAWDEAVVGNSAWTWFERSTGRESGETPHLRRSCTASGEAGRRESAEREREQRHLVDARERARERHARMVAAGARADAARMAHGMGPRAARPGRVGVACHGATRPCVF